MNSIKIIIAILLFSTCKIFAQVPHGINFQAIARDANGDVMENTSVQIRLTILDDAVNGTEIYQELRALTTNGYGSFSFQIGRDPEYITIGDFKEVKWGQGKKFLKVDFDPTNKFDWSLTLGTIEFATVPYAFAAETVNYIDLSGVQDGDALLYNAGTGKFEPGKIIAGQVDWSNIANKPNFAKVASSGDYNDLKNIPDFTGNYNELTNKPTIPSKISDFIDVNTSGALTGQVLSFDGSVWVPKICCSGNSGEGEMIVLINSTPFWKFGKFNKETGTVVLVGSIGDCKSISMGGYAVDGNTLYVQGVNGNFGGGDKKIYILNILTGELINSFVLDSPFSIAGFRH